MTRDRAIEILRDDASGASLWELAEAVEMGIKALEEQRPHGEWIRNAEEWDMQNPQFICSVCGNAHNRITPFCDVCGTDMRKEGEEK